jgi:hypothetical protein
VDGGGYAETPRWRYPPESPLGATQGTRTTVFFLRKLRMSNLDVFSSKTEEKYHVISVYRNSMLECPLG